MSKTLPILFNTEMVRAVRDDRKTETRQIIKGFIPSDAGWGYTALTPKGCISCRGTFADGYGEKLFRLPCMRGDVLYIRETWSFLYCIDCAGEGVCTKTPDTYEDKDAAGEGCFLYRADYTEKQAKRIVWRPSIHMPKAAARTWLMVKDVRAERLQGMNLDNFLAEGAPVRPEAFNDLENAFLQAREAFTEIWDSTISKAEYGKYGWNANPWVWVIEFEECGKPEDIQSCTGATSGGQK